jgi:hypothetical protein
VRGVHVEDGERVTAGQELLRMESDELSSERVSTENEVRELVKQRDALRVQAQASAVLADRETAVRLEGELARTLAELEGAEQRLSLLASRIDALTARSPGAGVVATFQVRQNLEQRPVSRGELLLEVMDDQGEWRLELEVPEHRLGHVLKALEESEERTLPAEYVLATEVQTTYHADVREVATRANSSAEGTIVEVYADLPDDAGPAHPRIGAEVTAKIHCGERSLGYVLFGDVIEFVQRPVWW